MKRFGLFLIVLAGLLVVAALVLPGLIPASAYRDRVEVAAENALGRDVGLDGDIALTILPRLEVRASNVSIANAEGFGDAAFAEMSEMRVGVRLVPLLSRRVEITEFVLVDPTIRLQQRGGRNNWTFNSGEAAPAPSSGEGFRRRPGALPLEASFGDVRIENGSIYYTDAGQSREITGLDLSVALPSLDEATRISGALNADGEALTFNAELGSIRDFFEGRETPLTLAMGGRLIDLGFDGRMLESEEIAFDGDFNADIPSIRALAAFAGTDMPAGENLERFSAEGALAGQPGSLALTARALQLDDIRASGTLNADVSGARPRLNGALELPTLDVTPYLPEEREGSGSGGGVPPWSEDPIDLAGLNLLDADLRLGVGTLRFRDLEVSDARLRAILSNGRLEAVLENFDLYQGSGSATIVANNRGRTPSFSLDATLDGLDAQPFLTAAAGFDRLQGTGQMRLRATAAGNSQASIMRSVDGNGGFSFADGAIVGINIAETIRNVNSFFSQEDEAAATGEASESDSEQASVGERQSTDFTELGGSFTIADGRITNQDLLMLSPLLRVEGNGWVNLPEQTLDYRLRPRAVASIQGQGGDRDMRGIVVPIRFRGDFNSVSYGVDTEAVGQALLGGAIGNALGVNSSQAASPEDAVRGALLNALGLGGEEDGGETTGADATENTPDDTSQAPQQATEEEEVDPAEQLLRNLLGTRREPEQPPEEEEGPNRR